MIARIITYLRSQVLGLVAIFIALGGTGYAAISIPKHSVGRRQLRSGAVGRAQLAKHSVGATQLRKHAVTQRSLAHASVGSVQLRKGSVRGNQLAPGAVSSSKLGAGSVGTGQIAAGAVGSGQLSAGAVGNGQLAAGSVGPGNLTGIGGFTLAFALVNNAGGVEGSPQATTSGYDGLGSWSNGDGDVHFQSGLGAYQCMAYSFSPSGVAYAPTAIISPEPGDSSNGTTVRVTSPSTADAPLVIAVGIECVA